MILWIKLRSHVIIRCWKQLAGEFWWELVPCTVVSIYMNVCHGQIRPRNELLRLNMYVMPPRSYGWLSISLRPIVVNKCNSKLFVVANKKKRRYFWIISFSVVCSELSSTFANLYGSVERAKGAMSNELKVLDTELQNLENNQQQLKLLRNKAIYIHNELDIFERNYIKGN